MKNLSLYIHIPFCKKKCNYCNFISFENCDSQKENYVLCLLKEIRLRSKELSNYNITSIYIGGGSPSTLFSNAILRILSEIKNSLNISKTCEISIEVNPESVTEEKLTEYLKAGVNRISIGGQSLNDKVLKAIGRIHSSKQLKDAVFLCKKVGFKNISVDMMLGLPGQKLRDIKKMLKFLVKNVTHISSYSLILENDTKLYNMVEKKEVFLPNEDETVKMYNLVYKTLLKKGFVRYEVSNFAKSNFECLHNLNYWQMGEYLAFGVAGHSYLNNTRFSNTQNLNEYISKLNKNILPIKNKEVLSKLQKQEETIMLNLRTNKGIDLKDFNNKFKIDLLKEKAKEIEFLKNHNLILLQNGHLKVKDNAFYVLNGIIEKLV